MKLSLTHASNLQNRATVLIANAVRIPEKQIQSKLVSTNGPYLQIYESKDYGV